MSQKYHYTIEVSDSPTWPVKDGRQAYARLHALGKEGRLAECVVAAVAVTEEPAWKKALRPKGWKK